MGDIHMKLTSDQLNAAWKAVQEKHYRGEIDIYFPDAFDIFWAAERSQGCDLSPRVRGLTPAEVQQAALEIIREHVPHLLSDAQKKRINQRNEYVLQCMADLRISVESLGRSIDGPGDRGAAQDLAREVRVDIDALIDLLRESMGDA